VNSWEAIMMANAGVLKTVSSPAGVTAVPISGGPGAMSGMTRVLIQHPWQTCHHQIGGGCGHIACSPAAQPLVDCLCYWKPMYGDESEKADMQPTLSIVYSWMSTSYSYYFSY